MLGPMDPETGDPSPTDETPLLDGIANAAPSSKLTRALYVSHFLSTCNSRIFEFGAVLFLADMFSGTLLPASVYALVRATSAIFFSPAVGHYVDTGNRLQIVRLSIVGQRLAVASSCTIFWYISTQKSIAPEIISSLLGVLAILACAEKLCSIMNTVSVERDWVIVIAGNNEPVLRALNSQMRRIDLFCKLAGPLVIALINGISIRLGIIIIFALNVSSITTEYWAIEKVYEKVPALQIPREQVDTASAQSVFSQTPSCNRPSQFLLSRLQSISESLSFYFHHEAFLPSMALSLLYFTVLNFSGQMVTYLVSIGYSSAQIGLIRTLSVVFEMSATWIAPMVASRVGPVRAGLWFINWQLAWVLVAVILFLNVPSPIFAASGLAAGVILSRLGLWGFDLCAQVIIQREVEPQSRGIFSSLEVSFQNVFELCSYAITIAASRPKQFRYPVMVSAVAVWISGILFAMFVRERRGHLLHKPVCLRGRRD